MVTINKNGIKALFFIPEENLRRDFPSETVIAVFEKDGLKFLLSVWNGCYGIMSETSPDITVMTDIGSSYDSVISTMTDFVNNPAP